MASARMMGLQISVRESGDVTILDLEGKAAIGVDNDLLNASLRTLVANGVQKLLLNLADVTQVDSSSIGTIVGTYVSLRRRGGSLKLLRPRGRVREVLGLVCLLGSIPTFEDEIQALASFRPTPSLSGPEVLNFGTQPRQEQVEKRQLHRLPPE